jgi:8-oxo-dGTP pyrophosphatase MutT (NUDIX family)
LWGEKRLDTDKVLENVRKALGEGKAIATGIGVFGAIFKENKILLRRRLEKESLIYKEDLSGKWELPGGGVELTDFGEDYQSVVRNVLHREVKEETGLEIDVDKILIVLLPAVLKRNSIEKLNLIDWAFVVPIDYEAVKTTKECEKKIEDGEIRWISISEINQIEIVSERMKYLINSAVHYYQSVKPQNRAKLF